MVLEEPKNVPSVGLSQIIDVDDNFNWKDNIIKSLKGSSIFRLSMSEIIQK